MTDAIPSYTAGYDAARLHVWKMIRDLIFEAQRSSPDGAKAPEVGVLCYLLTNTWFAEANDE